MGPKLPQRRELEMEEDTQATTRVSFVTIKIPKSKRRRLATETALPFAAAVAPLGCFHQHLPTHKFPEEQYRVEFRIRSKRDFLKSPTCATLGSLPSSIQAKRRLAAALQSSSLRVRIIQRPLHSCSLLASINVHLSLYCFTKFNLQGQEASENVL